MRGRISRSMITVAIAAAAVGAVLSLSITRTSGQTPAAPAARAARVGGKPNFSGIWQANNEANWDLQAHAALPGAVTQPGVYPYDYARVPAAPVLALGAAGALVSLDQSCAGQPGDLPISRLHAGLRIISQGAVAKDVEKVHG